MAVWIGCHSEVRKGDSVGGVLAMRGRRKGEHYGCLFVGACGVLLDRRGDGWGFARGGWNGMVERLEAPGKGVDADYAGLAR